MKAAINALDIFESEAWVPVSEGRLPEDGRTVIAWDSDAKIPCAALYDEEEMCWHAQADGAAFPEGTITHYRHYLGPAGESSGGSQS